MVFYKITFCSFAFNKLTDYENSNIFNINSPNDTYSVKGYWGYHPNMGGNTYTSMVYLRDCFSMGGV